MMIIIKHHGGCWNNQNNDHHHEAKCQKTHQNGKKERHNDQENDQNNDKKNDQNDQTDDDDKRGDGNGVCQLPRIHLQLPHLCRTIVLSIVAHLLFLLHYFVYYYIHQCRTIVNSATFTIAFAL